LFAAVLRALGYELDLLAGRVLIGATAPRPHTHLALRVHLEGEEILSDVGYGRTALRGPLTFATDVEQTLGTDRFRLVDEDGEFLLELLTPDGWEAQYLLDPRPEYVVDCEMGNHFVATHPESTMKQRLMVLRPTATGKRSLGGSRLVVDEADRQVDRVITADEAEAVLREEFGLVLPAPLPYLER
ncbi:MAG: arylamine N-acetyltransferase, partial [Patulibacter sp.]|nr:arylamine N-acetyltransferase [Patulibacter sp.]